MFQFVCLVSGGASVAASSGNDEGYLLCLLCEVL